ncbi:MAG: hypothetical protein AB7E79_15425 [Rhodospirillaceae bacterium]
MRPGLYFLAALFVAASAGAAIDYTAICNSSKLIAGDRHECRVQMTAANGDEARQAEIHRLYAAKIESLMNQRTSVTSIGAAASVPSDDR